MTSTPSLSESCESVTTRILGTLLRNYVFPSPLGLTGLPLLSGIAIPVPFMVSPALAQVIGYKLISGKPFCLPSAPKPWKGNPLFVQPTLTAFPAKSADDYSFGYVVWTLWGQHLDTPKRYLLRRSGNLGRIPEAAECS